PSQGSSPGAGHSRPLAAPGRPRSSLRMLAMSPDMAALCASIGTTSAPRSVAPGQTQGSLPRPCLRPSGADPDRVDDSCERRADAVGRDRAAARVRGARPVLDPDAQAGAVAVDLDFVHVAL